MMLLLFLRRVFINQILDLGTVLTIRNVIMSSWKYENRF